MAPKNADALSNRLFGHVPGYPVGSAFSSRAELSAAGVHRPTQAGIAGSEKEGADSIVLSGGYEDDKDWGNEILYTGQGGRDPKTGKQTQHQPLNRGNLALAKSKLHGLPVRVIRGVGHISPYAPDVGYRYDGLYRVEDFWQERGRSGYYVWRFRLRKLADEEAGDAGVAETKPGYSASERTATTTLRIVRDTKAARRIKALYDDRCQVCGVRLEGTAGPYAEAAHIRPLGRPHNGPDTPDNVLCLCPNHHVLFDYGGFAIAADLSLIGLEGSLNVHPRHKINTAHLEYHLGTLFLQPAGNLVQESIKGAFTQHHPFAVLPGFGSSLRRRARPFFPCSTAAREQAPAPHARRRGLLLSGPGTEAAVR